MAITTASFNHRSQDAAPLGSGVPALPSWYTDPADIGCGLFYRSGLSSATGGYVRLLAVPHRCSHIPALLAATSNFGTEDGCRNYYNRKSNPGHLLRARARRQRKPNDRQISHRSGSVCPSVSSAPKMATS